MVVRRLDSWCSDQALRPPLVVCEPGRGSATKTARAVVVTNETADRRRRKDLAWFALRRQCNSSVLAGFRASPAAADLANKLLPAPVQW